MEKIPRALSLSSDYIYIYFVMKIAGSRVMQMCNYTLYDDQVEKEEERGLYIRQRGERRINLFILSLSFAFLNALASAQKCIARRVGFAVR